MLFKKIFRGFFCGALALLPVGLYQGDPDSTDFQVGIHGGGGRVASVITGCQALEGGNDIEGAAGSDFVDVSGEVYWKPPLRSNLPVVVGVRGGYWRTDLNLMTRDVHYDDSIIYLPNYSFSYINPCISFETRYVGMGLGYVFGDVPSRFRDGKIEKTRHVSGHVRVGSMRGVNVKFSVMESSPQVSGGGLYDLSISVPLSQRMRSSYGLGFGPYYQIGFIQRNRVGISNHFALDINWRIGWSAHVTEYGVSGGLVYRLGLHR
ncbi:MAG TPA: hypothetical protein ENO22_02790 [candidate division Zixibacteria bacterium]|nr:hypothetical protein [candidate division Zixibacteria bacterium]